MYIYTHRKGPPKQPSFVQLQAQSEPNSGSISGLAPTGGQSSVACCSTWLQRVAIYNYLNSLNLSLLRPRPRLRPRPEPQPGPPVQPGRRLRHRDGHGPA